MGRSYTLVLSEDLAIEYFLKSLNFYQNILKDKKGIGMNFIDIGNLYYSQENYEFAFKYFSEALNLYEELNNEKGVATCYTNLGNVHADNNNISKGLDYYYKSIKIQEKIDFKSGLATNYNNIGDCYIALKQYNEAKMYFDKAMKIAEEDNAIDLKIIVFFNLADLYLKKNNIPEAINFSNISLKLAKEYGDYHFQIENLLFLSKQYDKLGKTDESYSYLKQYVTLKDSVLEKDKRKNVGLFQALNDLENKRLTINELSSKTEIAENKYENEKRISYILIVLIAIFSLFLIISINLHTAKKKAYNLLEFKNYQINKMNEEIQKQTYKLKRLNSTKDKFFSIIAHDLKNPFNSIQGFTELLIDNYKDYDDEKKLKFLKIIKGSSSKASNLVSNLLLWANNQSGGMNFHPIKIELATLVSESISFIEIEAINKNITIINNVDSHVLVFADENMIDTVMRNLISNAIKFTYSKGEVQIFSEMKDNFVEICVKDSGIGISQENLSNLFDIVVKNTSIGTANEHGSGLGLILCKDFIEKNGGKIWVESVVNVGSEFKFTLPVFTA